MDSGLWYHVFTYLNGLGQTPQDIAESMQKANVKGVPCSKANCPISNYIKKEFVEIDKISSSRQEISATSHTGYVSFSFLPSVEISEFIIDFDSGKFPQLEEV